MRMHYALLLLMLPPSVARAQVAVVISRSRTVTQRNGGPPDTLLMRVVAARGRTRIEFGGPATHAAQWRLMGSTHITVSTDSGPTSTWLDFDHKTYRVLNLRSMLAEYEHTAGVTFAPEPSIARITVDSLGSGGVIRGHNTIHFRTHVTRRTTEHLRDGTATVTDVQSTDYYVAPGLRLDTLPKADIGAPPHRVTAGSSRPPAASSPIAAENALAMRRISRVGAVVETVRESAVTSGARTRTNRVTTDLLDQHAATVSDSLFVVPAGFTRVVPARGLAW